MRWLWNRLDYAPDSPSDWLVWLFWCAVVIAVSFAALWIASQIIFVRPT